MDKYLFFNAESYFWKKKVYLNEIKDHKKRKKKENVPEEKDGQKHIIY